MFDDGEGLFVVVENEVACVESFVFVPLSEVSFNEQTSTVRRGVASDRGQLIGGAEDALHRLQVFKPRAANIVRMELHLTSVAVTIPMECAHTETTVLLLK